MAKDLTTGDQHIERTEDGVASIEGANTNVVELVAGRNARKLTHPTLRN